MGKGSVETSYIAVRILAYAHVSFPAVLCRGVAICIINRPDPGEKLGNNQGIFQHEAGWLRGFFNSFLAFGVGRSCCNFLFVLV